MAVVWGFCLPLWQASKPLLEAYVALVKVLPSVEKVVVFAVRSGQGASLAKPNVAVSDASVLSVVAWRSKDFFSKRVVVHLLLSTTFRAKI